MRVQCDFIFICETEIISMTRAWDKEKIWVPDRIPTYHLPNTRQALHSLKLRRTHGKRGHILGSYLTRVLHCSMRSTFGNQPKRWLDETSFANRHINLIVCWKWKQIRFLFCLLKKCLFSNLWTFNGIFSVATTRALGTWKFFRGSVSSVLTPKKHETSRWSR